MAIQENYGMTKFLANQARQELANQQLNGYLPDKYAGLDDATIANMWKGGKSDADWGARINQEQVNAGYNTGLDNQPIRAFQGKNGMWQIGQTSHDDEFDPGLLVMIAASAGMGAMAAPVVAAGGAAGGAASSGLGGLAAETAAGGGSLLGSAGLEYGTAATALEGAGTAGAGAGAEWYGNGGEFGGNPMEYGDLGYEDLFSGSGGSSLEPAGGWGDTQSLGQMNANGGTWGTQSGGSLFDQIKSIYDRVPPGTQQLIKKMMQDGDSNGLMSLLGKLGAAGLGAYGSNAQANSLQALAEKYAAFGAPSRARYEASMQPGFDPMSIPGYAGAVDTASKSLLARLSASGGSPFGNPGGLIDANKQIISGTALPAISEYQRTNLAGGGVANMSAAVPGIETSAIGKEGDIYSSLGYGLNAITQPKQLSLADLARAYSMMGLV